MLECNRVRNAESGVSPRRFRSHRHSFFLIPVFGLLLRKMNIGVHDGIIDKKHVDSIGRSPLSLYLWCLRHQTRPNGLVLGGSPITYKRINERLGQNERTLKRWMFCLRENGYIEVTYLSYKMMRIRVLKPKKFNFKQMPLPMNESDKSVPKKPVKRDTFGQINRTDLSLDHDKSVTSKQSVIMRETEATTTPAMPEGIAALIPLATWLEFVAMRKSIRKPLMPGGAELLLRKLLELQAVGDDPVAVIEQSTLNGWAGVFPLKGKANGATKSDQRAERTDTALDRVFGKSEKVAQNIRRALPPGNH